MAFAIICFILIAVGFFVASVFAAKNTQRASALALISATLTAVAYGVLAVIGASLKANGHTGISDFISERPGSVIAVLFLLIAHKIFDLGITEAKIKEAYAFVWAWGRETDKLRVERGPAWIFSIPFLETGSLVPIDVENFSTSPEKQRTLDGYEVEAFTCDGTIVLTDESAYVKRDPDAKKRKAGLDADLRREVTRAAKDIITKNNAEWLEEHEGTDVTTGVKAAINSNTGLYFQIEELSVSLKVEPLYNQTKRFKKALEPHGPNPSVQQIISAIIFSGMKTDVAANLLPTLFVQAGITPPAATADTYKEIKAGLGVPTK